MRGSGKVVVSAFRRTAVVLLTAGLGTATAQTTLQLKSPAFRDSSTMPTKYTCAARSGAVSPLLTWTDAPTGTVSFALIAHDLEPRPARGLDDILHWMVWNMPAATTQLAENIPPTAELPDGSRQFIVAGSSGSRGTGYRPPCAPVGQPHHYAFELFALDQKLDVPARATRADVMKAMDGHIVGHAVLIGLFARPQ